MIPILPRDESKKRAAEAGIGENYARLNAFRLLMQHPALARVSNALLGMLMSQNTIPARTRELVILRTGWRTGSEYEFCRHVVRSRALNLSEQEILGVRDPENCPAYSEVDRAVIRMADELHERADVSPATMATLEKAFSPSQLVELVMAAGHWRMMAGLFRAAKLPLDDDIGAGWPEGKRPPSA